MNVIIDQRTGHEIARFAEYVDASNYRRDILQNTWRRYEIRGAAA